jgi:thioredoxin reductase (NADPH)
MNDSDLIYDCIIIGGGPGGLQAAIHLGRYNRQVLLLDRGGGSTNSAASIENFLTRDLITGRQIIALGMEQALRFGTRLEKKRVERLAQTDGIFVVHAGKDSFRARFVLASSGVTLHFPRIKNLHRFFGRGFYTCVDCDGYHTTGKKLLIAGNSLATIRLAYGMKQIFTPDISILISDQQLPEEYLELAEEENFRLYHGIPEELLGEERLNGLRLADGRVLACEAIMADFGFRFNDDYLAELPLERDSLGNILVNAHGESSVPHLYVVGSLRPGNPQVIIAAGQGATAAIDINRQLLAI